MAVPAEEFEHERKKHYITHAWNSTSQARLWVFTSGCVTSLNSSDYKERCFTGFASRSPAFLCGGDGQLSCQQPPERDKWTDSRSERTTGARFVSILRGSACRMFWGIYWIITWNEDSLRLICRQHQRTDQSNGGSRCWQSGEVSVGSTMHRCRQIVHAAPLKELTWPDFICICNLYLHDISETKCRAVWRVRSPWWMNTTSVVYSKRIPNTLSCCCKWSPEHRICFNPPLKIIPSKHTILSCSTLTVF